MSMLEREVAPAATTVSSRAVSASPPSIDQRLLAPLQRTGCACGGTCGSCGPKDDQGTDVPTVMRLASSVPSKPPPAATLRKPPASLLHLQAKAGNRAVSRLVAADASRGLTPSGTATTGAPATTAVEPSVTTDGEPARQAHEEHAPGDAAPPPADSSPASPPPGSGDGRRAGTRDTDDPPGTARGEDRDIAVARIGGAGPTVQREDDGGGVLSIITGRATSVLESIRSRGRQIWTAIEATIATLVRTVTGMAQSVVERLGRALSALRSQAESLWSSLRDRMAAVGESLQSGFDALRGRLRAVWEQVKQSASGLLENLRSGGAALIERIRARVLTALGPTSSPGGACTTSEAIDRAQVDLPGGVDAVIAEFAAQATAGLAGLDGEGAGGEAQGHAGGSALEAASVAATATAGASASAAEVVLDGQTAAVRSDADAGVGDVQSEADAAVTSGQQRVDDDTAGLDQEGRSGIGGLGGVLSGLASAVLGRARQVIAGVRDRVNGVVDGLRQRAGAVLSSLGQRLRSILERVRSAVERVIDSAIALVRDVVARIGAAIAALRAAIERIGGLLRRLAQSAARLWSELRSRVAAGWSRLRSALASLRARAASLLPASDCTACEFRDAAQRADRLATTGLGALDLGSLVAGLAVALKRTGGAAGTTLPPEVVVARLGRGRPLGGDVRGRMEAGFGRSFNGVEVHTDDAAGRLADEMGARAFTVGHHVGFGPAQYQPGTVIGDALLAHELAHVAQGSGRTAPDARVDRAGEAHGTPESAETTEERDADETAIAVTARLWSGQTGDAIPISTVIRSGLAVRRCPKCCEINPPTGELKLVEAAHDCTPTLQSFDDAQESRRQNTKEGEETDGYSMGLTGLNVNAVNDAARLSATPNRKCDELCEVSTDRLPSFSLSPFYAVKAGIYPRPEPITFGRNTKQNVPPACRQKQMKKSFRITQAIAGQARAAEVEHCNDLKLGWNRSVAKYLGAVQELASGFCTPEGKKCEAQFKELVKARSGIENPTPFMSCAQSVSKGRDELDNHIFRAPRVVEVTKDCSEAIYEFPPVTKLGQQSSQELIDACGK